jgi:hypothetical protein
MKKIIATLALAAAVATPIAVTGAANAATGPQRQALGDARDYLSMGDGFSREGLIEQVMYDGFSRKNATYGVDHTGANWYKQAVLSARGYLSFDHFSCSGLIGQLQYDKYTHAQASYGAHHTRAC